MLHRTLCIRSDWLGPDSRVAVLCGVLFRCVSLFGACWHAVPCPEIKRGGAVTSPCGAMKGPGFVSSNMGVPSELGPHGLGKRFVLLRCGLCDTAGHPRARWVFVWSAADAVGKCSARGPVGPTEKKNGCFDRLRCRGPFFVCGPVPFFLLHQVVPHLHLFSVCGQFGRKKVLRFLPPGCLHFFGIHASISVRVDCYLGSRT